MAEKKTKWHETFPLNPLRPKYGDFSKGRTHWWDGKKWVKNNVRKRVPAKHSAKYFQTGDYGHGGPKDELGNGKGKTDDKSTKKKWHPKGKVVVRSVGTIDFNINDPKGLSQYTQALKAYNRKGYKNDKERDAAVNLAIKKVRKRQLSNRSQLTNATKLSDKTSERTWLGQPKTKKTKKGNNFKTNVHTRHYKTGERLGVMGRNQRLAYEKAAMGKDGKLRTFEGEVAKHEKSSGHGKSHLRETLYKSNVRKSDRLDRKTRRLGLKMGRQERTAGSPLHQPGEKYSLYNKDGTLKTKKGIIEWR